MDVATTGRDVGLVFLAFFCVPVLWVQFCELSDHFLTELYLLPCLGARLRGFCGFPPDWLSTRCGAHAALAGFRVRGLRDLRRPSPRDGVVKV